MTARKLTILQINDVHGYLEPHAELEWSGSRERYRQLGGYARIATLFADARAADPDGVIALDNGDTFHGTYPVVQSKGEVLVPILNALALDGMTAHWDFAYGPDQLQRLAGMLDYPVMASNCISKDTGKLKFPGCRVLERGGMRVGVIGLAALVDRMMPDTFSTGLHFTLGQDRIAQQIALLRNSRR